MKKIFSMRVEESLIKKIKHLAIDLNKSGGSMLEEAIQDVLKKYEYKAKPSKKS